jgi:hypothetical protein
VLQLKPAWIILVLLDGGIVLKSMVFRVPVAAFTTIPGFQLVPFVTTHSRRKIRNAVIAIIKDPMINNIPTILREMAPIWVKTIPTETANRATTIA